MAATNADVTKGVLMLALHDEALNLLCGVTVLYNDLMEQGRDDLVRKALYEARFDGSSSL